VTRRRFRLRDLEVRRIDLVDLGANQEAHIVFAKGHRDAITRRMNVNEFEGMTKEQIEALVGDAAEQLVEEGHETSIAAARASIWEGDTGVYEAHRVAKSAGPVLNPAPAGLPQTLREFAYEAIRKRAELASLSQGNWSKTIEQLVTEVLESDEGALVYLALSPSPLGSQPAAEVIGQVRKSAAGMGQLSEAISIATRWKHG
jgi:hypothetical protein